MSDDRQDNGQKLIFHPPKDGPTKGTKVGLVICALCLICLIGLLYFAPVDGESKWAIVADFILGLTFAIAVVWVVGGTIEVEWTLLDVVIKATGGAAVLLLTVFLFRPFYDLGPTPEWPISIDFPEGETLAYYINEIEDRRRENILDVDFSFSPNRNTLLKFRPISCRADAKHYNGNSWLDIFKEFGKDASCLKVDGTLNRISLSLDSSEIQALNPETCSLDKLQEGNSIFVCK